jgi:hypothetical protein
MSAEPILTPEGQMIVMAFVANNAKKALEVALAGKPLGKDHKLWVEEAANFWKNVWMANEFFVNGTRSEQSKLVKAFKDFDFFVAHGQEIMEQTLGEKNITKAATAILPALVALSKIDPPIIKREEVKQTCEFFAKLHEVIHVNLQNRRRHH